MNAPDLEASPEFWFWVLSRLLKKRLAIVRDIAHEANAIAIAHAELVAVARSELDLCGRLADLAEECARAAARDPNFVELDHLPETVPQ